MGTSIYRGSLLVLNTVTRNMSLLPRSSGDMTAIFLPCKNSKFPLSLRLRYCPFSTTSARSCTNSLAFIPCSSLRDRMCCSPQVSSPHIRSMSPISSQWNAPLTCPRFSCMSLSTACCPFTPLNSSPKKLRDVFRLFVAMFSSACRKLPVVISFFVFRALAQCRA